MSPYLRRPPARPFGTLTCGLILVLSAVACEGRPIPSTPAITFASPSLAAATTSVPATDPIRKEGRGEAPVLVGDPISLDSLDGKIVFDDFEDVFTMNADGSGLRVVAGRPGSEFDGAWSPDGRFITYRDSRRGINTDDEIFVVRADGSNATNITKNPANDWGPDWSRDGRWIVFNSDRDGGTLRGYLVDPTGGELRVVESDTWVEYPSFSPDGSHVVFMGQAGSDYDIYTVEITSGRTTQLTDSPGADGWPVWSPDGSSIAFATERDDCERTGPGEDCWRSGDPGEHHDIWLMNSDGQDQRRVSPEFGQFVAWSPDGQYLLVSGTTLFAIRPDGTGRVEIRPQGSAYPPGGIPDWIR
jgi:Tol biopolymer transport system component